MTDLWLVLTPILLADVLNPVLFAFLVYLAGGERGSLLSSAALAGHTSAYLAGGILIAFGFDQFTEFMENPGSVGFGIELALGLLLIWLAWKSRSGAEGQAADEPAITSVGDAFTTGAIVNLIGLPFAVPYFAAIAQILRENLTVADSILQLSLYNFLYLLPFTIVPLMLLALGARAGPILGRISSVLERGSDAIMPVALLLIGIALSADAVAYFATGSALF